MWVLGGIFAVVVAICIVGAVLTLATSSENVEVNLGDDEFGLENLEGAAARIETDGPDIFPDLVGGSRTILVNHVGDDAATGWVAVLAVAPGTDACLVDWDTDDAVFRDCEGETYPPDGTGLDQLPTRVEDDTLFVDLGRARDTDPADDNGDDPVITGNG